MNYEFSGEIIKILDDLANRFGIAIDWADKNVVPYLVELFNKFVSYKIATNVITIIIFVIVLCLNIWLWLKFFKCYTLAKETNESNLFVDVTKYRVIGDEYSISYLFGTIAIICSIMLVVFMGCFINSTSNLLKLIYIPELYVAEYLAKYVA